LWQNTAKFLTGQNLMDNKAQELKQLHDDANRVLMAWLEHPPKDRRQQQAFELLSDAVQLLYAASINLGLGDGPEGYRP
jgi:hypothetical protein